VRACARARACVGGMVSLVVAAVREGTQAAPGQGATRHGGPRSAGAGARGAGRASVRVRGCGCAVCGPAALEGILPAPRHPPQLPAHAPASPPAPARRHRAPSELGAAGRADFPRGVRACVRVRACAMRAGRAPAHQVVRRLQPGPTARPARAPGRRWAAAPGRGPLLVAHQVVRPARRPGRRRRGAAGGARRRRGEVRVVHADAVARAPAAAAAPPARALPARRAAAAAWRPARRAAAAAWRPARRAAGVGRGPVVDACAGRVEAARADGRLRLRPRAEFHQLAAAAAAAREADDVARRREAVPAGGWGHEGRGGVAVGLRGDGRAGGVGVRRWETMMWQAGLSGNGVGGTEERG
jgi:hypothetical protein